MSRMTLRESLTRALATAKVDVNLAPHFLPRGTNPKHITISSHVERPKLMARPRPASKPAPSFNMKDHYTLQPETRPAHTLHDHSPEYVEGVWRNTVGLPNTVIEESIRHAQAAQAVTNHAAQMEAHTMMTKGALHPFKTLEQLGDDNAPDRADTWVRAKHCTKVDVNLKIARLRALRTESHRITSDMGQDRDDV